MLLVAFCKIEEIKEPYIFSVKLDSLSLPLVSNLHSVTNLIRKASFLFHLLQKISTHTRNNKFANLSNEIGVSCVYLYPYIN